jgi:uncharacterized RDD family membrane protein YckC
MTARDERARAQPDAYPWHEAPVPVAPLEVETGLRGLPAGLVTRVLANAWDLLVVAVIVAVGYAVAAGARFLLSPARFSFPSPGAETLLLVGLGVLTAYLAITWAVDGGTYGDRLLGLRVVGRDGGRLHPVRCVLRAVLCTAFPLGLFWVLVSRSNRSVQDILVRTSVVYDT